jgi:hypothetical protein
MSNPIDFGRELRPAKLLGIKFFEARSHGNENSE